MELLFDGRGAGPPGLLDAASRRMRGAFRRFAWLVVRVRIGLTDVEVPRSGVSKRCRVSLETAFGRTLIVEAVACDWHVALGSATDRAGAALARIGRRMRAAPRSRQRARAASVGARGRSGSAA
jgi:hypothetical protein